MNSGFLGYVEIKTKITSIFAFLMAMSYLFYIEQPIDKKATTLFFAGMFLFDLTTTAINNYIDTKTNGQTLQFERKTAKNILFVMLGISSALGLWLVALTDLFVLLIGGICFLCGILYTAGPVPISRQPLGELLSGLAYGLLIPFLIFYINRPQGTYFSADFSWETLELSVQVLPIIALLLLSVAPVCCTANIMLANNICDLEKDIKVKRHTLPYYLGDRALKLFDGLYYAIYASIVMMVIMKILHPVCLFTLLTLIPVQKGIRIFREKQEKETTFMVSIKNFVIIMGTFTLTIFVSGWLT
jgi:1,4-dihydroxy-2-naphthoate polyprenyltransferase